jgi:hypothetical protein
LRGICFCWVLMPEGPLLLSATEKKKKYNEIGGPHANKTDHKAPGDYSLLLPLLMQQRADSSRICRRLGQPLIPTPFPKSDEGGQKSLTFMPSKNIIGSLQRNSDPFVAFWKGGGDGWLPKPTAYDSHRLLGAPLSSK